MVTPLVVNLAVGVDGLDVGLSASPRNAEQRHRLDGISEPRTEHDGARIERPALARLRREGAIGYGVHPALR
jgi:hypothetical protein